MPLRGLIYFGKQYESYIKQQNSLAWNVPQKSIILITDTIKELMLRCRTLEEYSILISRIYSKILEGISLEQAIDFTVQDCIHDNILRDFLHKHKIEVVECYWKN